MRFNASSYGRWRTSDELDFLARLGTHAHPGVHGDRPSLGRRPLLLGYRQGLGLRRVWLDIDQETVTLAADEALRALERAHDEQRGDEPGVCQTCGGSGLFSTCVDDLCHGQEECIHGDDPTCPACDGEGERTARA